MKMLLIMSLILTSLTALADCTKAYSESINYYNLGAKEYYLAEDVIISIENSTNRKEICDYHLPTAQKHISAAKTYLKRSADLIFYVHESCPRDVEDTAFKIATAHDLALGFLQAVTSASPLVCASMPKDETDTDGSASITVKSLLNI
jgi:hypothetical protein